MREKLVLTVTAALILAPIILLWLWPGGGPDKSLDVQAILERAIAAHGGRDGWSSARTLTREYTLANGDGSQMKKGRDSVIFPHQLATWVFDDTHAVEARTVFDNGMIWMLQGDSPVALDPAQGEMLGAGAMTKLAETDCRFVLQLPLRAQAMRYIRRAMVERQACHLVQETIDAYDVISYYFDTETFRLAKRERNLVQDGMRVVVEEYYSDYRQCGGIWAPFRVDTFHNGQRINQETLESLAVNAEIPAEVFTPQSGN